MSPATADDRVGERSLTTWRSAPGRALARWALGAARWARPHGVVLITLAVGLALCGLFTLGAAQIYDEVSDVDGVAVLDQPVLQGAMAARTPTLTAAVKVYTNLGGPVGMPVLATTVLALLAWRARSWEPLLLGAATGAGSLAMTVVGKAAVGRTRPPLADAVPPFETSFSFPSGHSLNALALSGIVVYVLVRRQASARARVLTVVLGALFALTMGLTRVYLGHHWLTDVVVAWLLALAWLVVVVTAHRLYLTTRRARV
jgi:membrane-associated phospholipid phosphatase